MYMIITWLDNVDIGMSHVHIAITHAFVVLVLLGLSRRFLLIFKYNTNRSEYLHGGRSHQKVVRASAKLKNPISHF
jgi:hypothetical protein